MTHVEQDDVFSRFVEERRELGFRGERPQKRRSARWLLITLIAVALGAGFITTTTTKIDSEITTAVR